MEPSTDHKPLTEPEALWVFPAIPHYLGLSPALTGRCWSIQCGNCGHIQDYPLMTGMEAILLTLECENCHAPGIIKLEPLQKT